jgi:hypothetical protein
VRLDNPTNIEIKMDKVIPKLRLYIILMVVCVRYILHSQ